MSKSSRLLITGGCSFTEESYYKQFGVIAWPRIIADGIGLELLNVGRGGNNNQAIENQIIDAVNENLDRDPIVMVLWTESTRLNVFDSKSIFLNEIESPGVDIFPRVSPLEYDYKALKHTLRTIWKTKNFVENTGNKFFHTMGLHSVTRIIKVNEKDLAETYLSELYQYNKVIDKIRNDWYFNQLDIPLNIFEFGINFSEDERLECGHPNQKGHEKIAEMFIDKYLKDIQPTQRFVYD